MLRIWTVTQPTTILAGHRSRRVNEVALTVRTVATSSVQAAGSRRVDCLSGWLAGWLLDGCLGGWVG